MSPEDFLDTVAFQALGATIPADNVAQRIQLENGIFPHSLDEQTEAFFAFAQNLLGTMAFGDVLEDHTQEIAGERKNLDRIDALANALVTIGNLSQVLGLARVKCVETPIGKGSF